MILLHEISWPFHWQLTRFASLGLDTPSRWVCLFWLKILGTTVRRLRISDVQTGHYAQNSSPTDSLLHNEKGRGMGHENGIHWLHHTVLCSSCQAYWKNVGMTYWRQKLKHQRGGDTVQTGQAEMTTEATGKPQSTLEVLLSIMKTVHPRVALLQTRARMITHEKQNPAESNWAQHCWSQLYPNVI